MTQVAGVNAIRAAKDALRKKLKKALASLSEQEKLEQSKHLVKKLLSSEEYGTSRRVSVYLSMKHEVKTEGILEDIFASGRTCFVPYYEPGGTHMEMLCARSMEDIASMPKTKWNISQPRADEGRENALATGGLDLIVFPGMGFTKEGRRIGHGGGYYDTYYEKCIKLGFRPQTVALAYSCVRCEEIPTHEHDTLLDKVIFSDEK